MCTQVNPRGGGASPANPNPSMTACKFEDVPLCKEQTCTTEHYKKKCNDKITHEAQKEVSIVHNSSDTLEKQCIKNFVLDAIRVQTLRGKKADGATIQNNIVVDTLGDTTKLMAQKIAQEKAQAKAEKRKPTYPIGKDIDYIRTDGTKGTVSTVILADKGHRDAIQLAPDKPIFGGTLRNITIRFNELYSTGVMQGVFASDGIFRNLKIYCNIIDIDTSIQGAKAIAINGMLSGQIFDNKNLAGKLVPIELGGIRLGGGPPTRKPRIYILSFSPDRTDYPKIKSNHKKTLIDNRSGVRNSRFDIGLHNFPLNKFLTSVKTATMNSIITKRKDKNILGGNLTNEIVKLENQESKNRTYVKADPEAPIATYLSSTLKAILVQELAYSMVEPNDIELPS